MGHIGVSGYEVRVIDDGDIMMEVGRKSNFEREVFRFMRRQSKVLR